MLTIGIIGIVAAITIPTIINEYKERALKVAFLNTVSITKNAFSMALNDLGITNVSNMSIDNFNDKFLPVFLKYLKVVNIYNSDRNKPYVMNFSNTTLGNVCFNLNSSIYELSNGSSFCIREGGVIGGLGNIGLVIDIDTNSKKGPNVLGFDVFELKLTSNVEPYWDSTQQSLNYCTKCPNSSDNDDSGYQGGYAHQSNGRYCAFFALKDLNPDDSSKKYWESLY